MVIITKFLLGLIYEKNGLNITHLNDILLSIPCTLVQVAFPLSNVVLQNSVNSTRKVFFHKIPIQL